MVLDGRGGLAVFLLIFYDIQDIRGKNEVFKGVKTG